MAKIVIRSTDIAVSTISGFLVDIEKELAKEHPHLIVVPQQNDLWYWRIAGNLVATVQRDSSLGIFVAQGTEEVECMLADDDKLVFQGKVEELYPHLFEVLRKACELGDPL